MMETVNLLKINVCDWVAYQTNDARKNGHINTRRGIRVPLWVAYRCLYCGEYFNQGGAEAHFGMSREDYNDEPHALSPIEVIEHIAKEVLLKQTPKACRETPMSLEQHREMVKDINSGLTRAY